MFTDPYDSLTNEQQTLLREVVATAYESDEDVGEILDRLAVNDEDERAVSDALAAVRQ